MNYCFRYYPYFENEEITGIDELKITLEVDKANKEALHDFISRYSSYRIIVKVEKPLEFLEQNKISWFENIDAAVAIEICGEPSGRVMDLVEELSDADLEFFFTDPARYYGELDFFINLGVSDVFLTGELAFDIENVSHYIHDQGVKVRILPNIIQKEYFNSTGILRHFFILPNHLDLYEPFVDVIEYWCEDKLQKTYKDIYDKGTKWLGNINELMDCGGEEVDLNIQDIPRFFGTHRLKCQQRCMSSTLFGCHMCDELEQLLDN